MLAGRWDLLTVLCDIGKGAFAVWAARHFTTDDRVVVLAMVAVVVGHVWPVQLWFRGGKGMATSLGALLIYDYHLTAAFVILFACAWRVLRKTVLPGLLAFACLPLVSMYLEQDHSKIAGISILAGLVLIAHRKNLMEEVWHLIERRDVRPKRNQSKL